MLKTVLKNFYRLMLVALIVGFVFYFGRGSAPFTAIASKSMEPVFTQGDLILTDEVLPTEVEEGDIIIFTVPAPIREKYGYPPSIAHRVIKVDTSGGGLSFRTKGDRTGEDPFTVLPKDITGKYRSSIPQLGYLVLFFYSKQGLIFVVSAGLIFLVYSFTGELSHGGQRLRRGIFAPIVEQNEELAHRQEQTSQMSSKALEQFASAMGEYAGHLKSHTAAVKDMASASQELKRGAGEQNKVLIRLMETMEQRAPKAEEVAPKVEKVKFPPGCVRSRRQPTEEEEEIFRAG